MLPILYCCPALLTFDSLRQTRSAKAPFERFKEAISKIICHQAAVARQQMALVQIKDAAPCKAIVLLL